MSRVHRAIKHHNGRVISRYIELTSSTLEWRPHTLLFRMCGDVDSCRHSRLEEYLPRVHQESQ